MKRFASLVLAAAFSFVSCFDFFNSVGEDDLTVSGLPGKQIEAYKSFVLTVDSPSSGYIDVSASNSSLVSILVVGYRQYKVTLGAPKKETEVTISFIQEEDGDYPELTCLVKFSILPLVTEPTPPPVDMETDLPGVKVTFTESEDIIYNPERGFYGGAVDIFSASNPVKVSAAKAVKTQGMSLMYVGFYLTDFMNGDISKAYLDMIQSSLDAIREAGIKCVLRFAYQNDEDSKPWDPKVDVVLRHVEQLKPIFQKNEDVIFVLQAGFVGVWGEWYYTANFIMEPSSNADYAPRKQLTEALLAALPESRQVALRTPQFKMRMYNLSLKDTLTADMAHDGSSLSRLSGHNDCFGASSNDSGTFDNEPNDRAFWKADTRYVLMGGETCKKSDYCTCDASLKDMSDYHWTYLNSGYNSTVLSRWQNSGCMDEIKARLGYRLVLKDAFYSENPQAGKDFTVYMRFCNRGFAAPANPRSANFVFVGSDGSRSTFPVRSDPRTWHPGWHVTETHFTLPSAKGTLYLSLEDPLLPDRPEYSIALANNNVFDSKTGLNKLFELK
jgi:hypothetical protein